MDFDTEKFIVAVKERPALWDLSSDEYSNKQTKKKMWEEITMLFGGSDLTTQNEKKHYVSTFTILLHYIISVLLHIQQYPCRTKCNYFAMRLLLHLKSNLQMNFCSVNCIDVCVFAGNCRHEM